MQPSRRLADLLRQARLDVGVDVFQRGVEGELAAFDLALDLAQPAHYRVCVGARDDALFRQHPGVRDRRANVLAVQRGVDVEGAGVGIDEGVRLLGEAPAPGLAAFLRLAGRFGSGISRRSFGRSAIRLSRRRHCRRWRRFCQAVRYAAANSGSDVSSAESSTTKSGVDPVRRRDAVLARSPCPAPGRLSPTCGCASRRRSSPAPWPRQRRREANRRPSPCPRGRTPIASSACSKMRGCGFR